MRINPVLLWGDHIENKSELKNLLYAEKLPYGYYVLLYTEDGRLEFIPSIMLYNTYQKAKNSSIIGIARSKHGAERLTGSIMSRIYLTHEYDSLKEYAREVLDI